MLVVDKISVRPLSVTAAEVTWEIVPTEEPLIHTRFHVLRSESPEGPYVDVSGPLVNGFSFIDHVNLKQKLNTISWRIRSDHVPTGVSVTYPNGNPSEAFIFHPNMDRASIEGNFDQDFFALEIVRRNNLLLRRFTGRLLAYFPVKAQGARCPQCWDNLKKRTNSSACTNCYGTGYMGGYYNQINVFIDVNPSPNLVQLSNFGKLEVNNTVMFMSNFPIAKPSDLIVEPTNRRWRVVQVNSVTQKRYTVQQYLQVEEIEKSDPEFLLPVDLDLEHPPEDFVGFYPKKYSPKAVPTEGNALL